MASSSCMVFVVGDDNETTAHPRFVRWGGNLSSGVQNTISSGCLFLVPELASLTLPGERLPRQPRGSGMWPYRTLKLLGPDEVSRRCSQVEFPNLGAPAS